MSYLANILEQPQALRAVTQVYKESPKWDQLHQGWTARLSHRLVLTGLGASFNALYPARYYLQQQGIAALHVDAGELVHYLPSLLQYPTVLVVVSQSGESIEIKRLLEQIERQTSAPSPWIISVTNQPGNLLAHRSNLAFYTNSGLEVGVATKTYTSTLALLHLLVRGLTGCLQSQDYIDLFETAHQCEMLMQNWQTWINPIMETARRASSFALVARGPSVASAYNGALVIQEAARCPAAGFSGSQFRHGPMEMLSPQLVTLLFTLPGHTLALSQRMAQDVNDRGGSLITIGVAVPGLRNAHISLPALDEWQSPMLDIVAVQLLVAKLAEAAGIIPGQFRWAGKVIQQE
jgi:glutamine---fructose-6-phosphate transaminase (isomerizing)